MRKHAVPILLALAYALCVSLGMAVAGSLGTNADMVLEERECMIGEIPPCLQGQVGEYHQAPFMGDSQITLLPCTPETCPYADWADPMPRITPEPYVCDWAPTDWWAGSDRIEIGFCNDGRVRWRTEQ